LQQALWAGSRKGPEAFAGGEISTTTRENRYTVEALGESRERNRIHLSQRRLRIVRKRGSDVTVVDFAELMLSSHVFPSAKADNLFRRVREQGQITKENVVLTEAQKRHLSLRRAA
jgi:uncharacterized protein involved in type VI secretion and phage assembly